MGCNHSHHRMNRIPPLVSHSEEKKTTQKKMEGCSAEFRKDFLRALQSRRKIVPLSVNHGKTVKHPLYQKNPPPLASKVAMESCPRKEITGHQEKLVQENFYLITEAYASRGYISIAIDFRYHGERAHTNSTYIDTLVSAWKKGDTMSFIFDTVWDLVKLADYLVERGDIDPARIGITGESLGGMHAWFAAAADARYSVAVPIIGVQGFRWALDNDKWQARVDSIGLLLKVWDRIAPGLDSKFDAPYSVPVIAPRPLLILNGADDPRCPLAGLKSPEERTAEAYKSFGSAEKFKLIAEPGIAHQMTSSMVKEASDWFDRFL